MKIVYSFTIFFLVLFGTFFLPAQANNEIRTDKRPLYHFGTPPYQKGQAIDEIRTLYKPIFRTPPIPHQAIVAHPSLPDHIKHKIQKVLPMIDPSLLKGLQNAGFAIRPDSFYDGIRLLLEEKK